VDHQTLDRDRFAELAVAAGLPAQDLNRAKRVVPIHTSAPERFSECFENVEVRANGEWGAA
jgi:hypothetical protein